MTKKIKRKPKRQTVIETKRPRRRRMTKKLKTKRTKNDLKINN